MTIVVKELIDAPRHHVWNIITDADRWSDVISGIVDVEILERPTDGVVGLKWREKRVLFGKEATETMWISAAEPNDWYEVTADNHGAVYTTRMSLADVDGKTELTMAFSARPTTFAARLMSVMGFLFNGQLKKMLQQDLADIRRAAEAEPATA